MHMNDDAITNETMIYTTTGAQSSTGMPPCDRQPTACTECADGAIANACACACMGREQTTLNQRVELERVQAYSRRVGGPCGGLELHCEHQSDHQQPYQEVHHLHQPQRPSNQCCGRRGKAM